MNSSIPHQSLSTEIQPLSYSKDDLIAGCQFIDISPSPPNMCRIRRAMNIFNAGAVHLIQNGKVNHQIYAVQSESDSVHFYTVQGEGMASLICECPDTLNGFECKHVFAVRYFNEQRREQAQIAEYEEYEANRGCAEDYAEGNRSAYLAESSATYAYAEQLNNEGCVKKLNDHLYSVRDLRIENRIDEDYSVGVNINFQPACLCTWSDRDYRCSHEIAVELYEAAQQ